MATNSITTEVIDKILLTALGTGTIATSLLLPGAIVALGPIFDVYHRGYNARQKEREYHKLIEYMKRQNLLKLDPRQGNGLALTRKGMERAKKATLRQLSIDTTAPWDEKWRMVMFDIPEAHKPKRDIFSSSLKRLGFYQLQRSVWLHPYPCREQIEALSIEHELSKYVTFIEVGYIDHQKSLKKVFAQIIK